MKTGRPREFDLEAALDAAVRLFWQRGFKATSLDELLAATGISRSSFYAAFGSKEALFQRCLARYCHRMAGDMGRALLEAESGRGFIEQTLRQVIEEARQKEPAGCLIMNSAAELGQRHPEFSADLRQAVQLFERVFQQAVLRAQAEGDIPRQHDARTLATYLTGSLGGLRNLARAGLGPDAIRKVIPTILGALTKTAA